MHIDNKKENDDAYAYYFKEVSAKSGEGVKEAMTDVLKYVVKQKKLHRLKVQKEKDFG